MKFLTKYALAAALVLPSIFAFTTKNADAATAVINKDQAQGVNVRSEAKVGDNIIGLIDDENSHYEIKDKVDNWYKIDFDGKEGYVSSDLFHTLEETEIVSSANFREADNIEAPIIEVLKAGRKVEAIGIAENGFIKVLVDGKEGYIYHNLLKSFRDKAEALKEKEAEKVEKAQQQAPAQNNNQASTGYVIGSNWAKEWIAQRESNGSYTAYNPRGGYYGRYQLNPSLVRYGASPAEQEAAADRYVYQRYGSWENAQAFWQRNGWY